MHIFFIRIKTKYFGNGLKEHLATDGYSLIFVEDGPCTSQCVLEFRRGLDRLGIYALAKHVKQFVNILQPLHDKLTKRNVI